MNSRGCVSTNHLASFSYVLLFLSTCFVFLLSTCVNVLLHLPEVNRKTRNENSQTNTGEYWIWPGSNAITHFNDSQKMNIATAKALDEKTDLPL